MDWRRCETRAGGRRGKGSHGEKESEGGEGREREQMRGDGMEKKQIKMQEG